MQSNTQVPVVIEGFGTKAWRAIKSNFVVFFAGAAVGGTATYLIMREPSEIPASIQIDENRSVPNYATLH